MPGKHDDLQNPMPSDEAGVMHAPARPETSGLPMTLAVAGGKGGVGKTSIALNLALILARQGYRTLLLDGDVELANVNVMLGLYPDATLEQVISGERRLTEVLVGVRDNLDLLPGASGVPNCLEQSAQRRAGFLEQLGALEAGYDRVIIDTAAGLQANSLHMIAAAHLTTIVITPDPTSLTDAFSLLKVLHRRGYKRQPSIIVNMARGSSQAQSVYRRFAAAVSRYIGISCHYLGAIWRDESIAQSIVNQTPVAMLPTSDPSCRQFWTLADMLSVRWSQGVPPSLGFTRYWARLLEKKGSGKEADDAPVPPAPKPATTLALPAGGAAGKPVEKPVMDQSWPDHFRAWLTAESISPMERYEVVNQWFALLGESLDEDMVETLQTGLANMDWSSLDDAQRTAAAAHFRQLADLVAPPAREPVMTPKHRYAEDLYGSQDALLDRLRGQPSGQSLSRILERLRATEDDFRRGTRRNSGGVS